MSERTILHLYADTGIEDEVLHRYGRVIRVGIDPDPNPFSEVIKADALQPGISQSEKFDLCLAHYPCQHWSISTNGTGDQEQHPDSLHDAREVAQELASHYILENVPQAPLRDPVELNGRHFGLPIHYRRAFETSFSVRAPDGNANFRPDNGPLGEQGEPGKQWVGNADGWRLAKGYNHKWPVRELKRHGIPAPYIRHLLYHWLTALDDGKTSIQTSISEVEG